MISVEFMLLFLVSLGSLTLIAGGMLAYGSAAGEKLGEAGLTAAAEGEARAAESALRCGFSLDERGDARIEESLIVDSGSDVIEIRGVFEDEDAEPV